VTVFAVGVLVAMVASWVGLFALWWFVFRRGGD
jgi:hypothetical protein